MTVTEESHANDATRTASEMPVRVLLVGPDTLYFSCDLPLSEAMRNRLNEEKATAQALADERRAHCPEWLGAHVCPQGAKGGYTFLIETEDFSVKLLGERIQNRPSLYLEMRSYALHTHPEGAQGACRAALAWVREKLYADQSSKLVNDAISFEAAKLSRADVHTDFHGGYAPSLSDLSEELRCFIRPGKTKGALLPRITSYRVCFRQRAYPDPALQQDIGDEGESKRQLRRTALGKER